MGPPSRRGLIGILVGLASALAALGVARLVLAPAADDTTVVLDNRAEVTRVLSERRAEGAGEEPPGRPERLPREPIPEEVSLSLFPHPVQSSAGNVYDPHVFYRYRSHLERWVPLKTHPAGGWTVRTNGLGLRRDEEVSPERPDLRILVAGDSHADGCCENRETLAIRLEELLEEDAPGTEVEVLNAARAGYSFYRYLGTLERFLSLAPHAFVVVVYGGNDFVECLLLRHYFDRTTPDDFAAELDHHMEEARAFPTGFYMQALRQMSYFRRHPEEEALAVETGVLAILEIERICREEGIVFLPVLLPPFLEIQPAFADVDLAEVGRRLGIGPRAAQTSERLSDAWRDALAARGVDVLDLRPAFRASPVPFYWAWDHHLNTAGHARAAELLREELSRRGVGPHFVAAPAVGGLDDER